jgi:hypothetical protein
MIFCETFLHERPGIIYLRGVAAIYGGRGQRSNPPSEGSRSLLFFNVSI